MNTLFSARRLQRLLLGTALLISCACTMVQVVPIQFARISQTEQYQQSFVFASRSSPHCSAYFEELPFESAQIRCIDTLFANLLGQPNWQKLKDLYGLAALRDEFVAGQLKLDGQLNFVIYVDPREHQRFIVEGSGRYFMIRQSTGAILMIGDYRILPSRYSIGDLDRGYLVLNIRLYVSSIPGQITYLHQAPLKYKIFIDNSMKKVGVYRIDYAKTHQAYMTSNIDDLARGINLIGELTLTDDHHDAKLMDFRGIEFLQQDYADKINSADKIDNREPSP